MSLGVLLSRRITIAGASLLAAVGILLAQAPAASAYSCDGGATTPVLNIVFTHPQTGYTGVLSNSGAAWCSQNVTAIKVTTERRSAPDGGPYVTADSSSATAVNANTITSTASGVCPAGRFFHFGFSYGLALDYPSNTTVEGPDRASASVETNCSKFPPLIGLPHP